MDPHDVKARLDVIRATLDEIAERTGRSDKVTLVAVSKTVDVDRIRAAIDAGQRTFGENRVQEAVAKMDLLSDQKPGIAWHLLGHLQTNKAKAVVGRFDCIQSVDSLRLATELNRRAQETRVSLPVLIEVNVAAEATKSGFDPKILRHDIEAILDLKALRVQGLMTIAPLVSDPEDVRWVFRHLRRLRDDIRATYGLEEFNQLSMGMSNDYRVAVEEGATIVRIGRALFGDRPAAPDVRLP